MQIGAAKTLHAILGVQYTSAILALYYSLPSSVCYGTVNNAFKLVKPRSYMCKIDLHSAYQSVPIHSLHI